MPPPGTSGDLYVAPGIVQTHDPVRILDTHTVGRLEPGEHRKVCDVKPTTVFPSSSVVVSITALNPTAMGYLAAFPSGGQASGTSILNFAAGTAVSNTAVIRLGSLDCFVLVNASRARTDVTIDVEAHIMRGQATDLGTVDVTPSTRLFDSRVHATMIAAGKSVTVQVPGSSVAAAALNLTVVAASRSGWLTAYPTGGKEPFASVASFAAGETRATLTLASAGPGGRVTVVNHSAGPAHLIIDEFAVVKSGPTEYVPDAVTPVSARRALDTRTSHTRLAAGGHITLTKSQLGIHPSATAAILAVTAVGGVADGRLSSTTGSATTAGSVLTYSAARTTTTTMVVAKSDGDLTLTNHSTGGVDLVVDVLGWVNPERAIRGYVSNKGAPVAGALIVPYRPSTTPRTAPVVFAVTQSDGSFAGWLPQRHTSRTLCVVSPFDTDGVTLTATYAPMCFPEWGQDLLDTLPGSRIQDFTLAVQLAGHLSGSARDEAGLPVTGTVVARRDDEEWTATTDVLPDGTWTLEPLPPGNYSIFLNHPHSDSPSPYGLSGQWLGAPASGPLEWPNIAVTFYGGTALDLSDSGTVTDLDFTLQQQRRVSGSFQIGSAPAPAGSTVKALVHYGQTASGLVRTATVAEDGTWSLAVPPGQYQLCGSVAGEPDCVVQPARPQTVADVTVSMGQDVAGVALTRP
jgi:hypothetical protein